jgi:hypothetical protein
MNDRDDEKLERLIAGALAGLAPRRAPAELERRVLEELARRAALAWWRRGFGEWPIAARTGFVIVCGLLVAALSLTSGFAQHAGAQILSAARPLAGLVATMSGTAALLARLVPPLWVYLVLSLGALLYLLLFGLGAFAYRTLYLQSNTAMIRS